MSDDGANELSFGFFRLFLFLGIATRGIKVYLVTEKTCFYFTDITFGILLECTGRILGKDVSLTGSVFCREDVPGVGL
jgi:hypothetical protein